MISNGAFCLAPNKKAAFSEILRVLKPGGRFSVSTSTMCAPINQADGKQWPVCMRMFIQLEELKPLVEALGFQEVFVDLSNSEMSFEIEEEPESNGAQQQSRKKIHGSSKEFNHL